MTLPANAAGHVDGQALACVLVDHGQAFQLLAISTCVIDEIVGPDLIDSARPQRLRVARRDALAQALLWHLQPVLVPDPMRAIGTRRVATPTEKDLHAAVAVARILSSDLAHRCDHRRIPCSQPGLVPQRRSGDWHQRARAYHFLPRLPS